MEIIGSFPFMLSPSTALRTGLSKHEKYFLYPLLFLLASLFWSTAASAQILPRIEPPPLVRFTGALLPLEEEGHRGLHTLTVFIKGQQWIFRLAKVETLTGRNRGWAILQDLFPPQVRFIGPEDLIQLLQKPESAGKLLTIEGRLYTGDRMFFITAVGEAAEKPKQTKPAGIL